MLFERREAGTTLDETAEFNVEAFGHSVAQYIGFRQMSETPVYDEFWILSGVILYCTVSTDVSLTPFSSAEMVEVPDESALARPAGVIVATCGSDEIQTT